MYTKRRAIALLIIALAVLGFLWLLTQPAHGQGQAIACYGDLAGISTYYNTLGQKMPTPLPDAVILEMQLWEDMGWFSSWLPDSYWLGTLWTPAEWPDGSGWYFEGFHPRLIMVYGQRHSAEVIVLVGNAASHTPDGWHPCATALVSRDAWDALALLLTQAGQVGDAPSLEMQ